MPFFGQDRELGEVYDPVGDPVAGDYDEIIDIMLMRGMDNDAIEDEIRNLQTHGTLNDMREGSTTGALGNVDVDAFQDIINSMMEMGATGEETGGMLGKIMRKRMTPERIHNLGILYGSPLTQQQIDYFENQLNRDPNQSYYGNLPEYPK